MLRKSASMSMMGVLAAFAMLLPLASAGAGQKQRIDSYQDDLESRITERLREYRLALLGERETDDAVGRAAERLESRADDGERAEEVYEDPFRSKVNVHDSQDGEGQDVEIRVTMPVEAFMEFAPIAALEAAAVTHKFPVVNIYLREETTDRVARIAFRDAEPIAGRYLAKDEDALEEMREALIWH